MEGIKKIRPVRISDKLYYDAKACAAAFPNKYDNVSDFIRVAIIELIREEYSK